MLLSSLRFVQPFVIASTVSLSAIGLVSCGDGTQESDWERDGFEANDVPEAVPTPSSTSPRGPGSGDPSAPPSSAAPTPSTPSPPGSSEPAGTNSAPSAEPAPSAPQASMSPESSAPVPSSSVPDTVPSVPSDTNPSDDAPGSMLPTGFPAPSVTGPEPSSPVPDGMSMDGGPTEPAPGLGPTPLEPPNATTNICAEDVPERHYIDGIPAYAQCADSESVGIWSNDGISTSASRESGWARTQFSGGYQCTELANRYLRFVWGVQSVPSGNAGTWCDEAPPEGLVQTTEPVHGDLIVFAPGVCGAAASTGHVAVVDIVNAADGNVTIVEQNPSGRRRAAISCAACFLHAVANDSM